MKWRFHHKARKAFLTTAICLALSQSVFAMPTGGKVIEGDITGITNGTIASGGTINVAGSGLIDWNAFGIGAGETLNYAFTSPGTLINHVTGADMSQLLGTLNSTGNGNLWLINPNGIVIGSNAQINASSLVLSTLNATDDALKGFLGGNDLKLTGADATKGIDVKSGAKINVQDALNMLGGHIQIADNVTVSSTGTSDILMPIVAAKQATFEKGDTKNGVVSGLADAGNTLTIGKATFNIENSYPDLYFIGHDVSLQGTKVNLIPKDTTKESTSLDVIAASAFGYEPIEGKDDENGWETFNPGNTLSVKGANLTANYLRLAGGNTTVDGSTLTLRKTTEQVQEGSVMPYLMVSALNGDKVVFDDVEGEAKYTNNTDGATLNIKDSTLDSQENISLLGNAVSVTNSSLKTTAEDDAKNNNIDIIAFDNGDDGTNPSNVVTVTGGSMVSGGDINVQGSKITFDGVQKVQAADGKLIDLMAGKEFAFSGDDSGIKEATADNSILVRNTKMSTNGPIALIGGKVDVTNSQLTTRDLEVVAGKSYTNGGNTITGTDATNVSIGGSTLQVKEDVTLIGSNINLADTKLEVGTSTDHTYGSNGVVRLAAAKDVKLTDNRISAVDQTGNLTMNKVNLSALGNVTTYSKTTKLQDSELNTASLDITALNTYRDANRDANEVDNTWKATPDNIIEISGSRLTNQGSIDLGGGKITVKDGSSLTTTGNAYIGARASYYSYHAADDSPYVYVKKAVDGMDVNVVDSELSGDKGVMVFGHTVTVDGDSSLTSKDGQVFLAAGKTVEMTDDSLKGDGAPVNIGKNVKYDADNTLFSPDKKLIETTTPSDPGTKPSDPGTNSSKPPVVTPDPQPAADIAKNIAQGQADMAKALQENPQQAAAAVQQQAEKLSRSTMTETEKVAQLKGYVEAIQATQESAETKNDLLVTVVKSFEPTQ